MKRELIWQSVIKSGAKKLRDKKIESINCEWSNGLPAHVILEDELKIIKRSFGKQSKMALISFMLAMETAIEMEYNYHTKEKYYKDDDDELNTSYRSVYSNQILCFLGI